ncbi:MAG TPA: hypothetical protein VJB05_01725 [archaeon]|nr:hypothetical protein [archaeon]
MSFGNIPIKNTEDTENCLFANCKETAEYSCNMCHIDICERHTRKPSSSSKSIKLCPDCFKIYEENKMGKKK